jgi:hypothetical protein
MKCTIIILLALTAVSCCGITPSSTPQDYCEFKFPRDMARQERCMGNQAYYANALFNKLIAYDVVDAKGNYTPHGKSRVEYKIWRICWTRRSPNLAAVNYCFDYWLDEYERTGKWGINSPVWQW